MARLRAIASFWVCSGLLISSGAWAGIKVGLVFDRGGKDDKSFNASAYAGAMDAKSKLGVEVKHVDAPDTAAFEGFLRSYAKKDFDLIIGIGFAQKDAIDKVAREFPKKQFALVDSIVDLPNVRSLMFEEHEGSYLVGALAAMASKTGKIGFVGGMDVDLIRRFELGYSSGAKKVNPKIQVTAKYVGVTAEAWNNPPKAKEQALAQYNDGADVIFQAAGASGAGVFDAAEEKKKFAIGVDSNQNWIKPGRILTSMLKRVDRAVFDVISDANQKKFTGGLKRFGLANQGVDFAIDEHNKTLLTADMLKRVNELKAEIISGKVKVPDYYVTKKK